MAVGVSQSGNYSLIRMDNHGNIIWGTSVSGNPSFVVLSKDNSYVVTGTISTPTIESNNIFLARYATESGVSPSPLISELSITVAVVVSLAILITIMIVLKKYQTTKNRIKLT